MEKYDLKYEEFELKVFPVIIFLIVVCLTAITFCMTYVVIQILGYSSSCIANISTILEVAIAFAALLISVYEYHEHMKRQRIQYLLDMGRKYSADQSIVNVVRQLEKIGTNKKTQIQSIDLNIHDIEMFMRFIEELQMLIDANVVNKSATLYLFGFYVNTFDMYHAKFKELSDYDEDHWGAFMKFAENAKKFKFNYQNIII